MTKHPTYKQAKYEYERWWKHTWTMTPEEYEMRCRDWDRMEEKGKIKALKAQPA